MTALPAGHRSSLDLTETDAGLSGLNPEDTMRLLALALILFAMPAFADDVGPTMAALKDAKAQCRYLLQLCGEYASAKTIVGEKEVAAKAAVAHAKQANSGAFQFGSAGKDAKRDAQTAMNWWKAAINVTEQKMRDVTTARTIMKAMHEKMPECVSECVDNSGAKVLVPW